MSRGSRTRLVRISLGRASETGTQNGNVLLARSICNHLPYLDPLEPFPDRAYGRYRAGRDEENDLLAIRLSTPRLKGRL
jgi:hypothetical protein